MSEIDELQAKIKDFADRRNWGIFHTPKNLAMAISGEAGELAAEFQWLTPEEAENLDVAKIEAVKMEIADVAIYLMRLSQILGINLVEVVNKKLEINESRFPEVK